MSRGRWTAWAVAVTFGRKADPRTLPNAPTKLVDVTDAVTAVSLAGYRWVIGSEGLGVWL